jgi:hypothetical protein
MFQGNALHPSVPLTQYAIAWKPREKDWFFTSRFLPYLTVQKDRDLVRTVDKGRMLQIYQAVAGTGQTKAPVVEFGIGPNKAFQCTPFSLDGMINHYDRKRADDVLQYEKRAVAAPRFALAQYLEKQGAAILTDPSQYAGNTKALTSTELWDDYDSNDSDPIEDLIDLLMAVNNEEGVKCNELSIDKLVWRVISQHPKVRARAAVHAEGRPLGIITVEDLEKILEPYLEKGSIKIVAGRYNAAEDPGQNPDGTSTTQTDLRSFIGANVIAAYVEPPSVESIGFGYTFAVAGLGSEDGRGGNEPMAVLEYEDNSIRPIGGTRLTLVSSVDQRIMYPSCGYLLRGVVDTTNARYFNKAGNSTLVGA